MDYNEYWANNPYYNEYYGYDAYSGAAGTNAYDDPDPDPDGWWFRRRFFSPFFPFFPFFSPFFFPFFFI